MSLVASLITAAMKAGKTVHFNYKDSKGATSARHAEPYEMKFGKLYSWDRERDASRQFFLEAMSDVREGEAFTPRFPLVIPT